LEYSLWAYNSRPPWHSDFVGPSLTHIPDSNPSNEALDWGHYLFYGGFNAVKASNDDALKAR